MIVRFLVPLSRRAVMRFSGMPQSPNPPSMIVAPSCTSAIASRASRTTLFNRILRSEQSFKFAKISSLHRVQNPLKTFDESLKFLRQEAGRPKDITPHMKRARRQTCHGSKARPRQILIFVSVVRKQRRYDLGKVADLRDNPIMLFRR